MSKFSTRKFLHMFALPRMVKFHPVLRIVMILACVMAIRMRSGPNAARAAFAVLPLWSRVTAARPNRRRDPGMAAIKALDAAAM